MPTEPVINQSETLILPLNIPLATHISILQVSWALQIQASIHWPTK